MAAAAKRRQQHQAKTVAKEMKACNISGPKIESESGEAAAWRAKRRESIIERKNEKQYQHQWWRNE
jgi:hypothetical protein